MLLFLLQQFCTGTSSVAFIKSTSYFFFARICYFSICATTFSLHKLPTINVITTVTIFDSYLSTELFESTTKTCKTSTTSIHKTSNIIKYPVLLQKNRGMPPINIAIFTSSSTSSIKIEFKMRFKKLILKKAQI